MSKIATAVIAAAAFAVTVPAFAAPAQSGQLNAKIIQKNGKTLYCVKEGATTGSRVPNRACLTKEEWAQRGSIIAAAKSDPVLASNPQVTNQN